MNTPNKILLDQYSGTNVQEYEKQRSSSLRWTRECEVFTEVLQLLQPESLLDCPVGTCRWAAEYSRLHLKYLIGLDASPDMISKSTAAAEAAGLENFTFLQGDILSEDAVVGVPKVDLVICIRFLNWLGTTSAAKAIRTLARVESRFVLLGVSLTANKRPFWYKARGKVLLCIDNMTRARRKLAPIHVHDESWLGEQFRENGWKVLRKYPIFEDNVRENFFYLLEVGTSNPK